MSLNAWVWNWDMGRKKYWPHQSLQAAARLMAASETKEQQKILGEFVPMAEG